MKCCAQVRPSVAGNDLDSVAAGDGSRPGGVGRSVSSGRGKVDPVAGPAAVWVGSRVMRFVVLG